MKRSVQGGHDSLLLNAQSFLDIFDVLLKLLVLLGDLVSHLVHFVVELLQQLVLFGKLGGNLVRVDE